MDCIYCAFFQESPTRIEGQRFCNHVQKMVQGDWEICEDGFEVHKFFWCKKTDQTIDLHVCPARQNRGMQECTFCKQKAEILEIRKYMGHKNGFMEKKKIIKKDDLPEPDKFGIIRVEVEPEIIQATDEELKTLQKKAIIKKVAIITAEQKPKIILHKINKNKPDYKTLHEKVTDLGFLPVKKLLKKK